MPHHFNLFKCWRGNFKQNVRTKYLSGIMNNFSTHFSILGIREMCRFTGISFYKYTVSVMNKQSNRIRIEGYAVLRKGAFFRNTNNQVFLSALDFEPFFLGNQLP